MKFRHYLLGGIFTSIHHSILKYLVKKKLMEGIICQWITLFQDFGFEFIVNPIKSTVVVDHILRIETNKSRGLLDNQLPNLDLLKIEVVLDYLSHITTFLNIGMVPQDYSKVQTKNMVVGVEDYQVIARQLYKLEIGG